jgi:hypothetical protein
MASGNAPSTKVRTYRCESEQAAASAADSAGVMTGVDTWLSRASWPETRTVPRAAGWHSKRSDKRHGGPRRSASTRGKSGQYVSPTVGVGINSANLDPPRANASSLIGAAVCRGGRICAWQSGT